MIDRARLGRDWLRRCRLDQKLGGAVPAQPGPVVDSGVDGLYGEDIDERVVEFAQAGGNAAQVLGQLSHLADALVRRVLDDDVALLDRTGSVVARVLALGAQAVTEELERQAFRDKMTGLGNRRSFDLDLELAVERSLAKESTALVVLMDLDGLKQANDKGGHKAGDALIVGFGQALSQTLAVAGQRYRWGGDEFALISEAPAASVSVELERLQGTETVPRFSWGLSVYGEDGEYPDDLVREADRRLYAQKLLRKASIGEFVTALERTLTVAVALARRTGKQVGLPL